MRWSRNLRCASVPSTHARLSQIRRAAESIPANIAEGTGRGSDADFARFLQMAIGSCSELESHLQFAVAVEIIPAPLFEARKADVIEVRRMLIGFRKKLNLSQLEEIQRS